MCRYRPAPEDFDDIPVSARSAEPMHRVDYHAKKNPRPARTMPRKVRTQQRREVAYA